MNRIVAITGGARGLGLATARELASRGCRVAIGDLDGDLASAQAAALPNGPHSGHTLDVTDPDAFEAFLDAVEEELGAIDVLVNNAGIMPVAPLLQEPPAVTRAQVEINVLGVITGTRLALELMLPRGRGHIVNVASGAGKVPVAGEAVYSATKHAVVGFDEALMGELEGTGVHITTVMPSLADTELAAGLRPPRFVPLVDPEQVAQAIARAIERPRLDVFVPAWSGPLVHVQLLLPTRWRAALRRFFRIEGVTSDIDTAARAGYVERTTRSAAHR